MSVNIQKTTTFADGLIIPEGAIVVPTITFPAPELYRELQNPEQPESEENQVITKRRRKVLYQNTAYQSEEIYKNSLGQKTIAINEIPENWSRTMTEQEYLQLVSNGALAEFWLVQHFNQLLGEACCTLTNIEI